MTDLGARFVACRRWRWMPGMLASMPGVDCGRVLLAGDDRAHVAWDVELAAEPFQTCWLVPVVDDPATLGCILALVREAWGRPTMHLTRFHTNVQDDSGAFTVPAAWLAFTDGEQPGHMLMELPDRRRYLAGATEAEAMLCALELAP